MKSEAFGGILLLVCAAAAILWSNSSHRDSYFQSVQATFEIFAWKISLQDFINEGLMAVFFLQVGMEIKREITFGSLANRRAAFLPVAAAAGGMLVPALIYELFNAGKAGAHGWGIPVATDIAFAVGVLSLLGRRVPLALKVFLLTLAVADDLGAVAIIALFYGSTSHWLPVAGAALGLSAPAARTGPVIERLRPFIAFVIMPLFALANAGVGLSLPGGNEIFYGVALGLLVGKPLGICAAAWIAVKCRVATLPAGVRWRELAGVGILGGIGFTMSLFVSHLSLPLDLEPYSKWGIFFGSTAAGLIGLAVLTCVLGPSQRAA